MRYSLSVLHNIMPYTLIFMNVNNVNKKEKKKNNKERKKGMLYPPVRWPPTEHVILVSLDLPSDLVTRRCNLCSIHKCYTAPSSVSSHYN